MKGRTLAVLFGLLGLCACDSNNDAPQQCEDFIDVTCMRIIECAITTQTMPECVAEAKTVAPCAKAVSVDSSFDACMQELRTEPCSVLASSGIPANCKNVINVTD